jgi:hypothetical protein
MGAEEAGPLIRPVPVVVITLPFLLSVFLGIDRHAALSVGSGADVRFQRPCMAFEGPLRIRYGAARKGPMRTSSCWVQPEIKILRLATLGDDGVEVDFVQTWMISRPFCARRSE